VRTAYVAHIRQVAYTPNDPDYPQQPYLDDINAPTAWDSTHGSSAVKIAVIDTGVDVTHPDLAAKIVAAHNAVDGTSAVTDTFGHGTFVAGVAAAATDNGVGVAGAGFDSSLLAVKVAAPDNSINTADEVAGINWAVANGADIINLSLGSPDSDMAEQTAIEDAITSGVLVVAAAGNDGKAEKFYPAAYPGVLSVGATFGGNRASFSNYGAWVSVGAPGQDITSTCSRDATTPIPCVDPSNPYITGGAGTSFSTPLVAGEAALLLAQQPGLTPAQLTADIEAATTGSYGFGHGRVDFARAVTPVSSPTIDTPTGAATIAGDADVQVTTSAAKVKVQLGSTAAHLVTASAGTATTTVETYGLVGPQTLHVSDCNVLGFCNPLPTDQDVVVDNGKPTLTAPADPTTVTGPSFVASATTTDSGSGVRFTVSGAGSWFDATAPYSVTIPTSAVPAGSHQVSAVICNRAGTVCDTGNPSIPATISVLSLHPTIAAVAPNPFSPNGDGVKDTATLSVHADHAETLRLVITNWLGQTARGPVPLSGGKPVAPGTYSWVWNGRNNLNARIADGRYTVTADAAGLNGAPPVSGSGSMSFVMDTHAPTLASVKGSGTTFYPVRDGYRDTFTPTVVTNERSVLRLYVYTSTNHLVRTIQTGWLDAGTHGVTWDGLVGTHLAPAGTYRFRFWAIDLAGNRSLSAVYSVAVSSQRLVAHGAAIDANPAKTAFADFIGACSDIFSPPTAATTWAGGIGYYSEDGTCSGQPNEDVAVTWHHLALPAAVKYANVRVAATGESHPGRGAIGMIGYVDLQTDATSTGEIALGAPYGRYTAPAAPLAWLVGGRTVRWWAGTFAGNWYQIRTFTVTLTYYTLQ